MSVHNCSEFPCKVCGKSKVTDIVTLAGTFTRKGDLQEYCNSQYITLQKAALRIQELEKEIEELKKAVPSNVEKIIVSPEEALIEEQISIISQRAIQKELTLEDTKKLDLLIKNKKILKEQNSAAIDVTPKKPDTKSMNRAQLISLATRKENGTEEIS